MAQPSSDPQNVTDLKALLLEMLNFLFDFTRRFPVVSRKERSGTLLTSFIRARICLHLDSFLILPHYYLVIVRFAIKSNFFLLR